jgi:hypothetical protein
VSCMVGLAAMGGILFPVTLVSKSLILVGDGIDCYGACKREEIEACCVVV